jgi:hypothetical protein
LLTHLGRHHWASLLHGDKSWGIEPVMAGAEQRDLPYLFQLRLMGWSQSRPAHMRALHRREDAWQLIR